MTGARIVLFVCPSRFSIGELYNAVRIGESLAADLHVRPVFVVTDSYAGYAAGSGLEEYVFPSRTADNRAWLRSLVDHVGPHTVVIADHQNLALERVSIDVACVYGLPAHIVVLDSLQFAPGPRTVSFGIAGVQGAERVRRWLPPRITIPAVPGDCVTLTPVPVASPADAESAVSVYTEPPQIDEARSGIFHDLGIESDRRLVVSAQSSWAAMGFDQISRANSRGRYAELRRRRILEALSDAGDRTVLVEIGAVGVPSDSAIAGVRAVSVPNLGRQAFTDLLAAADLYLTDNLISGAMAQAATIGTPVLALVNAGPRSGGTAVDRQMDELYPGWDFPYIVNPFGWVDELGPVLDRNPYLEAVPTAEFYHPVALREAISTQLSEGADRSATTALAELRLRVPSPASAFAPVLDRPSEHLGRTTIALDPGAPR